MKNKFKWFDWVFLIIFIISFLCLLGIGFKVLFDRIGFTYIGIIYLIGNILIFILSGDYIIDRIIFMLDDED